MSDSDDEAPILIDLNAEESTNNNESTRKVPVTILSGFLGSGKTTLLQYILQSKEHHYKIAVVENEFAGPNKMSSTSTEDKNSFLIESLIARDLSGADDTNKDSPLISLTELPNGCVCCTVRDSLVSTLESLIKLKSNLDYIIIEASGMANPGPIASIFWLDEGLNSQLYLDGIVTLVDARNIERQLQNTGGVNIKDNSHGISTGNNKSFGFEAERQIAYADRILINKIDLVSERELEDIQALIASINPKSPIQTTTYSRIENLSYVLGAEYLNMDKICMECGQIDDNGFINHTGIALASKHSHSTSVQTISLEKDGSVDLQKMHSWLAKILWPEQDKPDKELRWLLDGDKANENDRIIESVKSMQIFRLKGILSISCNQSDETSSECSYLDNRRYIIQAVHDLWDIHPASQNLQWGGNEKRTCKIVIIGQWLDDDIIREGFDGCFLKN